MRCKRGHSLAISIMLRGQSVCVQICKPWQDISRDDKPLWHSHDFPVQTVCASKICYKFWLSCDPRWVCPDFNLSSRLQYVGGKWQILHPDCGPLICSTVFAFTHVSHMKLNFFPFQQLLSENHGSRFEAAAHLNYLQALRWPFLPTELNFVLKLTDLLRNIPAWMFTNCLSTVMQRHCK